MKITFTYLLILVLSLVINIDSRSKIKLNESPIIKTNDFFVTKVLKRNLIYYTQGIFFNDNANELIESGGLYTESVLVKMEYPSLKTIKTINLSSNYFAEGIAKCGGYMYQLTWQEKVVLKYTYPGLEYVDKIQMDPLVTEGWGLCETSNPNELIATDGSANIFYLDCQNNLKVTRSISVTFNNKAVIRLNALAYAEEFIWANVYFSNFIYKIDPVSGNVIKRFDMSSLLKYEYDNNTLTELRFESGDVLNGIAYDKINKRFLLTGKKWGFYYETTFK